MKIMIVENDEDSRVYLERVFEAHGYEVVTYINGEEALRACYAQKPKLIISDIMMPGMDGFEFCRNVKGDDSLKDIPFIFYTATFLSSGDEALGLSLGASRYIIKPLEWEDLSACIQEVLKESDLPKPGKQNGLQKDAHEIDSLYKETLSRKLDKKAQELKVEHQALQTEMRKSTLILETAGEGILGLDNDGNHTFVNPAAADMLGYTERDLQGRPGHKLWHYKHADGTEYPEAECPISGALRTGKSFSGESDFIRKDGTTFPVYCISKAVVEKNEIVGAVVSFMDISERKNLEEQLRQSQKLESLGILTAGIAHDFNNLISIVSGYSELIKTQLKKDDPILKFVDEIYEAGKRSASLTRQLLIFSRKNIVDTKVFKLSSLVLNMEKMLRRLIGENIEFVIDIIPDDDYIKADEGQIEQVFMNLVVNSRDAMPDGGKMTIKSRSVKFKEPVLWKDKSFETGQYLNISVTDTGCGITEWEMERIFDPFFTTKKEGKGTGLGLYTVFGIIKESNGFINVSSKPGEVTTFEIYFPLARESAKQSSETKICEETLSGHETILVVEDDAPLRDLVCRIFRSNGYNVIVAPHGGIALLKCEQYKENIHLVLCDVVMPDMDGPQIVKRLELIHPEMKTLFMSGYVDDSKVQNEILENHVDFIQKPFTSVSLLKKIRDVLSK